MLNCSLTFGTFYDENDKYAFCLTNHHNFCNLSSTYPSTHPTIFTSLYYGAFKLENPYKHFSFLYNGILTKSNLNTSKGSD